MAIFSALWAQLVNSDLVGWPFLFTDRNSQLLFWFHKLNKQQNQKVIRQKLWHSCQSLCVSIFRSTLNNVLFCSLHLLVWHRERFIFGWPVHWHTHRQKYGKIIDPTFTFLVLRLLTAGELHGLGLEGVSIYVYTYNIYIICIRTAEKLFSLNYIFVTWALRLKPNKA